MTFQELKDLVWGDTVINKVHPDAATQHMGMALIAAALLELAKTVRDTGWALEKAVRYAGSIR